MGISGIAADYYPAGYVNSKAAKVEERVLRRSLNRNQWRQDRRASVGKECT